MITYKKQREKALNYIPNNDEYAQVHSMLIYFGSMIVFTVLTLWGAFYMAEMTNSLLMAGMFVVIGVYVSEILAMILKEHFYVKFCEREEYLL